MAKVLIVDDHPITRDGLAMRLASEKDLEVCGEAGDFNDALKVISKTNPDIAVIDVSLENSNGIELVKEVKYRFPELRMLVWSMYDESLYAERALKAGASGYINKKNVRETIITAIRTVLAGNVYLSPEYSAKILNRLDHGRSIELKSPSEALSDRELETFTLIGHGLKTAEIAKRMALSTKTIETYRNRIKQKLEIDHAGELSRVAILWVLGNS
ncbi:MAG: DNA-binding NarL/FixJ family response regulator [Mariniblastus sp.]|jgi:DNA-binding NarL/FixJ family response regulator